MVSRTQLIEVEAKSNVSKQNYFHETSSIFITTQPIRVDRSWRLNKDALEHPKKLVENSIFPPKFPEPLPQSSKSDRFDLFKS